MDYEKKYKEAIERLKQWDKEHPNGYVISDRDEFIFPELKEIEGEKVRKWLINLLSTMQFHHCDDDAGMPNKALSWIEKQGEQKTLEEKADLEKAMANILKVYAHTILCRSLTQDELNETDVYAAENTKKLLCFLEYKPTEWSEEDESMLFNVIHRIEQLDHYWNKPTDDKMINWLKFLKNRVQPQQEWSEEDEKMLNQVIEDIVKLAGPYVCYHKDVDWLNSLKDRYAWKPSDEQLDSLYDVLNPCDGFNREVLESLYVQLKKLREE